MAIVVLASALPSAAARADDLTYEVGPGKTYTALGDVPWETLGPGDTVRIHARPEPYHEKVLLSTRGTAEKPIRVVGVPAGGELPVISGEDATTRSGAPYRFPAAQSRGLVTIALDADHEYGYKPGHIEISGLELRDAAPPFGFTGRDGASDQREYWQNAAAIWVSLGEHIAIRHSRITRSGNGIFISSGGDLSDQAGISSDIVIEGNDFVGNGTPNGQSEHQVYSEAIGILFEGNHFGALRPTAIGSNLKDRSVGTVIRYNRIEGGARLIDLVDPQDQAPVAVADPRLRTTLVYGNLLINNQGDSGRLIHYGGDSGEFGNYRKGTLYFHHNTLVNRKNYDSPAQETRTEVFQLSTADERADVRNNVLYNAPATAGATPTDFFLLEFEDDGRLDLGRNWISPDWGAHRDANPGETFDGAVTGAGQIVTNAGNDPGFTNAGADDFRPAPGSPLIDAGVALSAEIAGAVPVCEYGAGGSEDRALLGAGLDLGALEAGDGAAAPCVSGTVPPLGGCAAASTCGSGSRVTAVSIKPKRFSPTRRAAGRVKVKARRGAKLRFTASEAGSARIDVVRLKRGRRVGSSCLRPTPKRASRARCTRKLRAGRLAPATVPAGRTVMAFRGWLKGKPLRPGRYRVRVAVAGSSRRAAGFRIRRR